MAMVEPEIEAAPWQEQARVDAPLYLKQIEYLFARSRFYRDKLSAPASRPMAPSAALKRSRRCR